MQIRHVSAGLFHHIVCGSLARRHSRTRQIGHRKQYIAYAVFRFRQLVGNLLLLLLKSRHSGLCRLRLLLLSLLHQGSYGRGKFFKLGGDIVIFQLLLAPHGIESYHIVYSVIAVKTLHGQALYHTLWVFLYLLKCKHLFS
jgi:hypothetical protein